MPISGQQALGASKPLVVGTEHVTEASDLLCRAFINDPPSRWLFPDADVYHRAFPAFTRAFSGSALVDGTVSMLAGVGVSMWLAPGRHVDEEAVMAVLHEWVPSNRLPTVFRLLDAMARVHPELPHWYCPLLGVVPSRQRQGMGAMLMQAALEVCDAQQMPAYLEASSPRSVPFYQRFGFIVQDRLVCGDCPPIFPMWRAAQARQASR